MEFSDQTLICSSCGTFFLFSADEQRFFREKQFTNPPKRCRHCRALRAQQRGNPSLTFIRTVTATICAGCGQGTTVPFKPVQGRPVLCRACFGHARAILREPEYVI